MSRPRSGRLPARITRGGKRRWRHWRWRSCFKADLKVRLYEEDYVEADLQVGLKVAAHDDRRRAPRRRALPEGVTASCPRSGAADALSMGGRARLDVRGAADVLDAWSRHTGPAARRPPGVRDDAGRRRGGPLRGARPDRRRGGRALAARAEERDGPADSEAGRLRVPARTGDAGQGDHQRGARAGAQLQRRRIGAVHQWHPRRHPPQARTRMTTNEQRPQAAAGDRDESDQVVQRRANLEALRALGVDPYPRRFDPGGSIEAIVAADSGKTGEELEAAQIRVRTAGRILAIRSFGKANFLVLSDGKARLQVYIRQDAVPDRDFKIFKLLDFGDWVGVEGRLFRTKTNEFTIWASQLEFLAKCLLPLPEKRSAER